MQKNILKRVAILVFLTIFGSPLFSDLFHPLNLVKKFGDTIVERIDTPFKFSRIPAEKGSFADYIRNYPLKNSAEPLLLYNGNKKQNQEAHAAIFSLPLENRDLQNASGSIIALYAQYMYKMAMEDKISFHFTNGGENKWLDYKKNAASKRTVRTEIAGNLKKWTEYEKPADRNEIFKSYVRNVLAHTSILSMQIYDSEAVDFENLRIGDILMDMANHKHVCLVVDMCENSENGERAVLLAQGFSPAQEFHVIRNPKRINDPWYYIDDMIVPLETPEYTFPKESWRRLKYVD